MNLLILKINKYMKTLNQYIKESLLCKAIYNESILDDEEDLINNSSIEIIEKFIKDNYNVTGKLDIKESNNIYIVNYNGDVRIKNDKITQLTNDFFEWGVVKGDFYCFGCKSLKSLQGAPKKVDGGFYCYNCASLTSLEGAPEKVGGRFYCRKCKIQFTEDDVKKVSKVKGEIIQ